MAGISGNIRVEGIQAGQGCIAVTEESGQRGCLSKREPMNYFLVFSIANILFTGAVSSYTDLRYGKIFNVILGWGFIAGFLILTGFYGRSFDGAYLAKVLINGFLSLITGYFLWVYGQWSAGDAKLFAFFSFFIPLSYYQKNYIEVFPSINVLVNAFFIAVIFICGNVVFFVIKNIFSREKSCDLIKRKISRAVVFNLVKAAAIFCLVIYLLTLSARINFLLPVVSNNLAVFFIMFFLFGPLFAHDRISKVLSIVSLFVLTGLFLFQAAFARAVVFRAVLYVGAIGTISYLFNVYIDHSEIIPVKVRDLRSGQVPVDGELEKAVPLTKEDTNEFNETKSYGLHPRQIKIIKKVCRGDEILKVYKTLPLGPIMFGAVIITLLTGNSLIKIFLSR